MCPHDLLYTNCSKRVPICVFAEDLPPGPDNHSDDKVADLVDSAKMPAVSADGRTEDLPKAASESVGTSFMDAHGKRIANRRENGCSALI